MLSGIGVSRIQNVDVVSAPKRKSMPSAPARSVTPISPRARCSAVRAAHRHTSQTAPSAAVTRAATVWNPVGTTPATAVDSATVPAATVAVGRDVLESTARDGDGERVAAVRVALDDPADPLHAAASSSATGTAARPAIAATVGVSVGHVPDTTCDSCGAAEEDLYAVHRQYVTPAEWDTPGREVTLDEIERWCYSCLTHYPHVLVGDH